MFNMQSVSFNILIPLSYLSVAFWFAVTPRLLYSRGSVSSWWKRELLIVDRTN